MSSGTRNWKSANMSRFAKIIVLLLVIATASTTFAQYGWRRNRRQSFDVTQERNGVPRWEHEETFQHDTFRFVRIRYQSKGYGPGWATDFPDSDLNFSLRLQQLTSIRVHPDPIILELTDEKIYDYPFLYIIEPGSLWFDTAEVDALRRYCLNGGFLMVDDFWGQYELDNFLGEIGKVFPDRAPHELPLSHEIFHIVYDLKEKPQIPSIRWAFSGDTWEDHGFNSRTPHYMAITDDDDRIMVLICHNTDLGDGWEREGENREYFEEFSVKKAYPLGINIVTYAMTH